MLKENSISKGSCIRFCALLWKTSNAVQLQVHCKYSEFLASGSLLKSILY